MSECIRCGEAEAVPGKLGDRCRECIVDLLEEEDEDDDRGPELTLVLSAATGQTRRLRIRTNPDPGAPFLLHEDIWTGCAWAPQGTEQLTRVEIDGVAWHEADGGAESTRGP